MAENRDTLDIDKETKENTVRQVLKESLDLAKTQVTKDPDILNKILFETDRPQKRILAEWVVEARRNSLKAINKLIVFRIQATEDLKAFDKRLDKVINRGNKVTE